MRIRRAAADELIDLRHAVLRAGHPREAAMFTGDDDPSARHFAAETDGKIIGCATLHLNEWKGEPAWQLRGMAVDPAHQNNGIGGALLRAIDADIAQSPTQLLWCNGRTPAAAFYERNGWTIASDVFDIPASGPHYKMVKRVVAKD